MAFFTYSGTSANGYFNTSGTSSGGIGATWPLASGVFLCAMYPLSDGTYSNLSTQAYGILLQYGQTKQVTHNADAVATIYHGRQYPSVEHGKYHFLTVQCSYLIPPFNLGFGVTAPGFGGTATYYPGRGFDGSMGWMTLAHLQNSQQAIATPLPGLTGPTVTQFQDIWGRRSTQQSNSPLGLTGIIYNLQIEDLVNPSGWQRATFTFSETGIGLV